MIIRISIILLFTSIFVNFSKSASADCYSAPANTIGTSGPCAGMLIVNFNMLQAAVNNRSYSIWGPDSQSYTLADSDKNIFTGQLTSLENLFRFKRFNGDINYWDVSNVTSLRTTFRDNNVFTGDISSWDVSNVTDMRETFRGAVFNGDISSWDVSSVTNMELTFFRARNFNQNISSWNVSNVSKFGRTFHDARYFDQDIRSWSVKSGANFSNMFLTAMRMNAAPYNAPVTPTAAWFTVPDTTAPTLSSVSISSDNSTSSKAVPDDVVSLTFTANETIQSPTVTVSSGGAAVNGNVSVSNTSGNTWTASFTANANDTAGPVTYSIAFSDTAGNAGTSVTSTTDSSNVAVVIDTSAPTLSSVSISSNNANRSKATPTDVVTLSFTASETIQPPTVTASSGGAAVNGNVSVSNISGNTWTASFTANANDTAGPVTYSIAFSDTAGNAGTTVTSTTDSSNVAVVIDTDLPTLLSSNPSDGSRAVKLDQNIVLKFSEVVTAGSGKIKLFDSSGKLVEAFTVSSSIISGATVTLNPSADFASRSAYYIQIPSTAFVDGAGNGYTGISNKTGLDFVTLDVNAPSLISSVPSDNAASVKLDKNIILTFSESVVAGSGDIKLFDGNGRLVEAFTVSSSIISGATVTLNPATDLKPDKSYYIQIPSTAFTDAAGNNYAGIINKTGFDFTTRKKTPKEAFTEVKDDIGSDMKANTTKQIRSFATATTAVVTAARGRVLSKRVSSSRSRSSNRSAGGGGSGSSSNGSSGSGGGSSSGTSSDGTSSDSPGGTDADTESSFDLRSSTRGTNASGQINSVLSSYDGKVTRYSETQFSYTKSENDTETGSASSQIIFEREKSENLTVGHFIGFSLSKNSTVGTKSTDIESIGLQVGAYFVDNITDDLFVDGYLAGSLLTNKMEVTTATMTAEADYVSRMLAAGAAVTGSFDVARWEILPTLALDHSTVSSQDASFEVTFGGGNSNELSSPGNVKQLSLTFSPDFRTDFDYYNGYWAQGSTFSFKPKFTCQRINQGTITKECGQGTALSLITQDEDAMKTLSFTLGVDKIAGDTTYSANALYKFEF